LAHGSSQRAHVDIASHYNEIGLLWRMDFQFQPCCVVRLTPFSNKVIGVNIHTQRTFTYLACGRIAHLNSSAAPRWNRSNDLLRADWRAATACATTAR